MRLSSTDWLTGSLAFSVVQHIILSEMLLSCNRMEPEHDNEWVQCNRIAWG